MSYYRILYLHNPSFSRSYTALHKNVACPLQIYGITKQAREISPPAALSLSTKNLNRQVQKMTYCCRWVTSKQLLFQSMPALTFQNGANFTTVRNFSVSSSTLEKRPSGTSYNHKIISDYQTLGNGYKSDQLLTQYPSFLLDVRYNHRYGSNNTERPERPRRRGLHDVLPAEEDPFSVDQDTFGEPVDTIKKPKPSNKVKVNPQFTTFDEPKSQEFDSELSFKDEAKISLMFPQPKVTLNNLIGMLGKQFYEITHKQATAHGFAGKGMKYKKGQVGHWTTTFNMSWPEQMVIQGNGVTKQISQHKAAEKVLHWLFMRKNIDDQGLPIYDKNYINEMKRDLNRPLVVNLDNTEVERIVDLLTTYRANVEPLLMEAHNKLQKNVLPLTEMPSDLSELDEEQEIATKNVHTMSLASQTEYRDSIFSVPPEEKDQLQMEKRNALLLARVINADPEVKLPITLSKKKIIDTISTSRAVVIRGAPGCGKSTRTPSYLLDAAAAEGKGAECCVLVSQPRRVAALALASRVAGERGEEVGDVIGHQVRLSTKLPRGPGGAILYCTAGALLRRLASSPELLGCSHLILDEAHERSADSDAVMTLAKRAMVLNPRLKVIVMSATLDVELFSKYFDDCPILDIPGFTFPVTSHYLEDFGSKLNLTKTLENSKKAESRAFVETNEFTEVVKWVDKTKPDGAILCFLPGWQEIRKVRDNLEYQLAKSGKHVILPVHSRLSNEDQKKIFTKPPEGVRKIILATNIAETSITINDVSYVIDSGVHKEHRLMDKKGISSLDNDWISRASVAQRRGRAGRVKPGECFHLYTKSKQESFVENPIPEILRVPLEKTVMDCKTYSVNEKAADFLGQFPQAPSSEAIGIAVSDLINMGALDEDEQLTALGRRIAPFTTHPKISKALVHATIFKVASPVIDLSTILSNNIDLFSCSTEEIGLVRRAKEEHHPTSDHLALYWLSQKYQQIREKSGWREADFFCRKIRARRERMNSVYDLRKICVEHLQQCRMLPSHIVDRNAMFGDEDMYSNVDELVKGVLLSGLNTMLHIKYTLKTKGKLAKTKEVYSDLGQHAFISSSSVNASIHKHYDSGALLYCGAVHSKERRGLLVRDTSVLQPITVFLFSQHVKKVFQNKEIVVFDIDDKRMKLQCTPEQANLLLDFHSMLWCVIEYYIENKGFLGEEEHSAMDDYDEYDRNHRGHLRGPSNHRIVEEFKDTLVKAVATILNDAEVCIDSQKTAKIAELNDEEDEDYIDTKNDG